MYNERDALTSKHEITLDGLKCGSSVNHVIEMVPYFASQNKKSKPFCKALDYYCGVVA